jgi:hypothetical protein
VIRSPHDAGETLVRINHVLATFFDPNLNDDRTRAGVREEFVRALSDRPQWAVHRAFDDWVRTRTRRPSPAEIVILVNQHLEPMTRELALRRKHFEQQQAEEQARLENRCSKERAAEMMEEAGFTVERLAAIKASPMASSFAEAEAVVEEKMEAPHWTETVETGDERLKQLAESRSNNPLVKEARAYEAAQRKRGAA